MLPLVELWILEFDPGAHKFVSALGFTFLAVVISVVIAHYYTHYARATSEKERVEEVKVMRTGVLFALIAAFYAVFGIYAIFGTVVVLLSITAAIVVREIVQITLTLIRGK